MVDCEMCGKSIDKPVKVIVEGTSMTVCSQCAAYGRRLEDPKTRHTNMTTRRPQRVFESPDTNLFVVSNYGPLVKLAREKKGLKQEQVAKSLNEKESIIHKIESGNFKPSLKLAKKIERFFGIKITETLNE